MLSLVLFYLLNVLLYEYLTETCGKQASCHPISSGLHGYLLLETRSSTLKLDSYVIYRLIPNFIILQALYGVDVRVLQSWLKRLGRHWLIDYQCLYRVETLKCKNGLVTIYVVLM